MEDLATIGSSQESVCCCLLVYCADAAQREANPDNLERPGVLYMQCISCVASRYISAKCDQYCYSPSASSTDVKPRGLSS